jgi:hypothetical protein
LLGAISGAIIFKIILIIWVITGITIFTQRCNVYAERLNMHEKAEVFHKVIYDVRSILNDVQTKWNPYNMTWFDYFNQLHEDFHDTTNINAKFKIIQEIQEFFDEKDRFFHEIWYFDDTGGRIQDEIYHQTIKVFNQMD